MPTYTMTIVHDDHITGVTASPGTSVSTATNVKLTPTFENGYELNDIRDISGRSTNLPIDVNTQVVQLGKTCTIAVTSKKSNMYIVTERCMVSVNDVKKELMPNTEVLLTKNGAIKGMLDPQGGTEIPLTDAVQSLIDQGILVKI